MTKITNMNYLFAGLTYSGEIRGLLRLYNTFYLAEKCAGMPLIYEWILSTRSMGNGPTSYYLGNDLVFMIHSGLAVQTIRKDHVAFTAVQIDDNIEHEVLGNTQEFIPFFEAIGELDWQTVAIAAAYVAAQNETTETGEPRNLEEIHRIVEKRKASIYTDERIVAALNFIQKFSNGR